jgi:hypothetical protein
LRLRLKESFAFDEYIKATGEGNNHILLILQERLSSQFFLQLLVIAGLISLRKAAVLRDHCPKRAESPSQLEYVSAMAELQRAQRLLICD